MKAEDVRLTELLKGPKQFIVPVFQRDYSWGTKHCLQLWKDILRVGSDNNANAPGPAGVRKSVCVMNHGLHEHQ